DGEWVVALEDPATTPPSAALTAAASSEPDRNGLAAPSESKDASILPTSPPPAVPPSPDTPTAPAPRPAAAPPRPAPRTAPRPSSRIRVDATQLDDLVGLAGELAVLSDNLMGLREIQGATQWLHALESLQRVSREIRDTTLDLRMVPVDELFSRVPRIV